MSSNRKSDKEIIDSYTKELPEWNKAITLEAYSPDWPNLFKVEKEKINRVLGKKAIVIEHVGSTAVPNLSAKPKIDILLVVVDSSNESERLLYERKKKALAKKKWKYVQNYADAKSKIVEAIISRAK